MKQTSLHRTFANGKAAARKREKGSVAGWIIAILLLVIALVLALLLISRWVVEAQDSMLTDPFFHHPDPQPVRDSQPDPNTEILSAFPDLETTSVEAAAPDAPAGGLPEEKNNEKGDE